jgi:hypothetical protein
MGDFKDNRAPPPRPSGQPVAADTTRGARQAGTSTPASRPAPGATGVPRDKGPNSTVPARNDGARGRIVHDERGTAMWDWLKETGRIAIESTSRLLRKLELPELKVEDKKDEELRIEPDRNVGGGYDPYNQAKPSPPKKSGGRK